mgnify:CR=1 FL=1
MVTYFWVKKRIDYPGNWIFYIFLMILTLWIIYWQIKLQLNYRINIDNKKIRYFGYGGIINIFMNFKKHTSISVSINTKIRIIN